MYLNKNRFYQVFLLFIIFSLIGGSVSADTRWYTNINSASYHGTPSQAITYFLKNQVNKLGLKNLEFKASSQHGWLNSNVVRYQQYYSGIKVFGGILTTRINKEGRVKLVVDGLVHEINANSITPSISRLEAVNAIETLWNRTTFNSLGVQPSVELGLLPSGHRSLLVYKIDVLIGLKSYRHYVDALNGTILWYYPLIINSKAKVYPENPLTTPELTEVELNNLAKIEGPGNVLEGAGDNFAVYNYKSGDVADWDNMEYEHIALGDDNGDFLYEPSSSQPQTDDPFAEVSLYYYLEHMYSYFSNVLGTKFVRKIYGISNFTQSDMYGNENQPYDNAFFTPIDETKAGICAGQGQNVDYSYDGDVIMHEFGHFVIDETVQLNLTGESADEWGYAFMPPSLHEGLADYFAATNSDNGIIAEYALGENARNIENNNKICPDDVMGESHMDGEIIGAATWEIRQSLGADSADKLIYGAILLLTPDATFEDFSKAVEATSEEMVENNEITSQNADDVKNILVNRGLDTCGRTIDLSDQTKINTNLLGLQLIADAFGMTCSKLKSFLPYWMPSNFQYKITVPDNLGDNIVLNINLENDSSDNLKYKIYVRQGEKVHYELDSSSGYMAVPVPDEFDYESPELTTQTAQIKLNKTSTPPLVSGETYYFTVGHQNCPDVKITTYITLDEETIETDAGTDIALQDGGTDTTENDINDDINTVDNVQNDVLADADAGDENKGGGGCSCEIAVNNSSNSILIPLFLFIAFIYLKTRKN